MANTKASGTARPTRPTVPWGLMLAAIEGAISAIEMPIASQIERLPARRPPGFSGGWCHASSIPFDVGRAGRQWYAQAASETSPVCRIYNACA